MFLRNETAFVEHDHDDADRVARQRQRQPTQHHPAARSDAAAAAAADGDGVPSAGGNVPHGPGTDTVSAAATADFQRQRISTRRQPRLHRVEEETARRR